MSEKSKNDEIQNKVINIFQRHKKGDQYHFDVEEGGHLVISPDGFNYVSFKMPPADVSDQEESTLELASKKHYLIKMLERHRDCDMINHYYIPGSKLNAFLTTLKDRAGEILEIDRFYPDGPA